MLQVSLESAARPRACCQTPPDAADPSAMWLFTPTGFLSIVADYDAPGHALVRARVLADLEAFCARTGAPAPTETPHRDYRFRTSVPLATLAAELAAQAAAIDYPSFKSEVAAPRVTTARTGMGQSGR